jgi:nitrate reductase NapE
MQKKEEFRTWLFLTAVLAPVLAVLVVSGYGFVVWISQIIGGPPGS